MSNACGNTVQSLWVSGVKTCRYSSTEWLRKTFLLEQTYGKLLVTRFLPGSNPLFFAHIKIWDFNLLKIRLSTVSTAPIITTKKNLKEI